VINFVSLTQIAIIFCKIVEYWNLNIFKFTRNKYPKLKFMNSSRFRIRLQNFGLSARDSSTLTQANLGMAMGRVRGELSYTRINARFQKSHPYSYPYPSGIENNTYTHTHRVLRVCRFYWSTYRKYKLIPIYNPYSRILYT